MQSIYRLTFQLFSSCFSEARAEFQPSTARWYILALTGYMGMVQSLVWMGWGTVSQSMYFAYPDWDDRDIGLLGNWGEICFLVFSLPATWIMGDQGSQVRRGETEPLITHHHITHHITHHSSRLYSGPGE